MGFEQVFVIVLFAATAVVVLSIVTTAARHRRMDERHAKLRDLRRQAQFGDARGVRSPERIRW